MTEQEINQIIEEKTAIARAQIFKNLQARIDGARQKLKMVVHTLDDCEFSEDMAVGSMAIVWDAHDLLGEIGNVLNEEVKA